MKATWKPFEAHGSLMTRSTLRESVFAFSEQREEPLTDAQHVRNAIVRFDQVIDVSDEDRSLAFENIKKAANYYGLNHSERSWPDLGVHPRPQCAESAIKGAETRKSTGESEEAALNAAATKKRLGIAEEAVKKAATTRRRERKEGKT